MSETDLQVADLEAARKKKNRVRSAWISFVGRIVAQIVGAAASIGLGLFLLNRAPGAGHSHVEATAAPTPVQRPAAIKSRTPGEVGLVVLPFQNFSDSASRDYVADGMTEAITAGLAQVPNLRVVSRTSAMRFKGTAEALPDIAGQLHAELAVEGSVVVEGNRVRVTAQLIEAATDAHLWARSYEEKVTGVLALQSHIAQAIADEVREAVASALSEGAQPDVAPAVRHEPLDLESLRR